MTNKRRKYKFNWLDHLYYMGVNYGPARWPMPFEALIYSILMWPFVFIMILLYKRDEPVIGLLFVVCMGLFFHFYDWPLKNFFSHLNESGHISVAIPNGKISNYCCPVKNDKIIYSLQI